MRIAGIVARGLSTPTDIEPQPVKAVLFDFSGTLFHTIDDAEWIRAVAQEHGADLDDETVARLVAELEAAWALREVARAQHARDLSTEVHRAAGLAWIRAVEGLAPLAEPMYDYLTSPRCWVPYDDTRPVLEELHRRGLPVAVVSDIAWDIRETFEYHRLRELVDVFALSYEHGATKPDPRLFGYACEELGVDPRQVLVVGDTPGSDGGGAALGMRAYILPATGATARRRGLDAVLRLVED
ncbi:MAG: HAD-IA family hydrolase [Streptosporangiales bacterium]|nr:HAD-IA family hydrolase [Streptosporangiales bacterium]